jgi:class 3 adenylate cyclase
MGTVRYKYKSVEDYLASTMLTIDGTLDDGWGANITVKGREIDATILFSDITAFSRRTQELLPAETLIFVQHFFTWVTAEALRDTHGIIDKYIGDEFMILFSKEFGSDDPFNDAIVTGRHMSDMDAYNFCPHVGIASGRVIVGHVGTALKYNTSVYGSPVALAARCASIRPELKENEIISSSIVFPAAEWGDRDLAKIYEPRRYRNLDGSTHETPHSWELRDQRTVSIKNLPNLQIREIVNRSCHLPQNPPENWAKQALKTLEEANRYWPYVSGPKSK